VTVIADEVVCAPRTGTLYDVLDLVLDRGIVIDVFIRVSLVGIEILKIDARVVVASVDTYLRFAEVCNRLDLESDSRSRTVPELFGGVSGAVGRSGARRATRSLGGKVKDALGMGDEGGDADEEDRGEDRPRRRATSGSSGSRSGARAKSRGKEG
jgi:hypothetical protein